MAVHPYTRFFILPAAPTVDEDESEGYEVGDVVFYAGSFYDCSDVTTGAAVWTERNTGGSGTPGGSDGQIQFNDGGAFGGAKLKYSHAGASAVLEGERTGDNGDPLEIKAADADNDGSGGELLISSGAAPGDGNAGTLNLSGGDAGGSGDGGSVLFTPGQSATGAPGRIQFRAPGNANKLELNV